MRFGLSIAKSARRAQGLPVNMIVLTALALLVLVVVGAFFISGFGEASGSVQVVEAEQADCQAICQGIATAAFNYNACNGAGGLEANPQVVQYISDAPVGKGCAGQYGDCTVTIRGGNQCTCGSTGCN